MAYPFAQWPTLDEFINQVSARYGVQRDTGSLSIAGPLGSTQIDRLWRNIGGRIVEALLQNFPSQQRLTPSTLRALCNKLEIPLDDFGLTLQDIDNPDFGHYQDDD